MRGEIENVMLIFKCKHTWGGCAHSSTVGLTSGQRLAKATWKKKGGFVILFSIPVVIFFKDYDKIYFLHNLFLYQIKATCFFLTKSTSLIYNAIFWFSIYFIILKNTSILQNMFKYCGGSQEKCFRAMKIKNSENKFRCFTNITLSDTICCYENMMLIILDSVSFCHFVVLWRMNPSFISSATENAFLMEGCQTRLSLILKFSQFFSFSSPLQLSTSFLKSDECFSATLNVNQANV